MKVAIFEFANAAQEIVEDWTIYEREFYKWIGTDNPTQENLDSLADRYMRDFGNERGYEYYRAYFEEVE